MFDIKVSANTPAELTAAIVALAAAMQAAPANPTQTAAPTSNTYAAAPAIPPAAPPVPAAPAAAIAPPPPAQPAMTPSPAPAADPALAAPPAPAVPVTSAPAFTREQIMMAGAALIDAGKMGDLMTLLSAFGAQAVTQLKQEQLGAFATELRKLGAQI